MDVATFRKTESVLKELAINKPFKDWLHELAAEYIEKYDPNGTEYWSVRQEQIMTTHVVAAAARNQLAARCESFIECGTDHSYSPVVLEKGHLSIA
ncbi:hypothetical protein E4U51_000333 [Claviceps purpurea]|nr:hypothetical protein E4U51_000333 [Claviceps purpurea]